MPTKCSLSSCHFFSVQKRLISLKLSWTDNGEPSIRAFSWTTPQQHVYVKNFTSVKKVTYSVPTFDDHVLVQVDLNIKHSTERSVIFKRDWTNYAPRLMN